MTAPARPRFAPLLLATAFGAACTSASSPANAEARAIEALVRAQAEEVVAVRGRSLVPPPVVRLSRAEFAQRLRDQFDEVSGPGAVARNERLYRALGVLGRSGSWWATFEATAGPEIGGQYDPVEDRIVLVDDGAAIAPELLRHELTHALQDQHWVLDLERLFGRGPTDAVHAAHHLIEGEAAYVQLATSLGVEVVDAADLADLGYGRFRIRQGTPAERLVRASGWHPYAEGAAAIQQLRWRGGWAAVDATWGELPLSTEALLTGRPEDRPRYAHFDVSGALGPGWAADPADTLGAALLRDVLWAVAPAATDEVDPSVGWDGDRLQVLHHADGRLAFVWRTVWDAPADATRFAALAPRVWQPGPDPLQVEVRGDEVLLVSGLPIAQVAALAWRDPFVEVATHEALRAYAAPSTRREP